MEQDNNANVNSEAENSKGTEKETEKVNYEELIKTDKGLQSFLDSRVSSSNKTAIENARKQWELERDTEKTEAEKLAKMNKEQKLEYQAQKERTDKEKALAELNAYKLKEQATKIASEKGLDISLLTFFNFETVKAEEINSKIEEVSNAFNKAVEKAVNERLKEDTPIEKTGFDNTKSKSMARASY